jgi:hypothetical protein
MPKAVISASRRVLSIFVLLVAGVIAVEILMHTHRNAQCLDVTSGGCERWSYSGTAPWAIAVAVAVGLVGLLLAVLVYEPRSGR